MTDIQSRLIDILREAARRLAEAGLPPPLVAEMERLGEQVRQPCRVAVVGEVKAGKSSFLNALLGQDLAKVGTTETTATINYFLYGQTDPARPVVCVWRDGKTTAETPSFLDSLQGNDLETLRRADGIARLEYHVLSPYLERVTLIDTPGMGAVVEEHGERTADFLNLYGQLRERHDRETWQLGRDADAVIYLVGAVARANDRTFLEQFQQSTGGQTPARRFQARAHNAIGVLAKVDLQPEILARREELAARIAEQLGESLNTVIPVSAGVRRALDHFLADEQAGLRQLMALFRSMPPEMVAKALAFEDVYLDPDLACTASIEERERLLGDLEWSVFTTVARLVADAELDIDGVVQRLDGIAGFGRLRELLERHFVRRGQYLRGYRILSDARAIVSRVKFRYAREHQQRQREQDARRERLIGFIRAAGGDPDTARELEEIVHTAVAPTADLRPVVQDLERLLGRVFAELEEYNADFEALLQLEDQAALFTPAELDELRPLFGLYGMETERRLPPGNSSIAYIEERQQYWYGVRYDARALRSAVAERAVTRYGFILDEMLS